MQRFDSTKFYERKPYRKFGAIEPPFAVLIVGKAQRFDSTKFSERKPFRKFGAIEPPPSLLSVFAMDDTAVQRFDSTKFYERKPYRKFGAIETALRCPYCWKAQRFDSTKFSERKPFRKFGVIESPPLCCQCLLWITQQCSGSIAPNFMFGNPPENLVLSNRPSLSSLLEKAAVR